MKSVKENIKVAIESQHHGLKLQPQFLSTIMTTIIENVGKYANSDNSPIDINIFPLLKFLVAMVTKT